MDVQGVETCSRIIQEIGTQQAILLTIVAGLIVNVMIGLRLIRYQNGKRALLP